MKRWCSPNPIRWPCSAHGKPLRCFTWQCAMPSNAAKSSSVRTCLRVFCTFLSMPYLRQNKTKQKECRGQGDVTTGKNQTLVRFSGNVLALLHSSARTYTRKDTRTNAHATADVRMAVIIKGRKEALSWITEGRHIRVLHAGRKVQWHMAWNRAHNPCSALLLKNLSFLCKQRKRQRQQTSISVFTSSRSNTACYLQ